MVIHYDLPVEAENYVHRIGRTARAGKTGKAVTLASEQDVYELPAIERYIGKKIPSEIAMRELHVEDKSSGQHIRTEFYEDRREERHLHGNAKAGEGRGARPHGESRGGRRHEARRADRPQTREQDLSRLSLEERMALYRQKYTGLQKDSGESREAAPQGGRSHGGRRDRKRPAQHASQRRNFRQQDSGSREDAGRPKESGAEHQQKQAAPEKKGIVSRIMGIFRKK
jgi:ATP-dependent RNA helicase RhlB